MSFAQMTVVGYLGQDPELRDVNGTMVAKLSVAVTERWKDKNSGEQRESTSWFRCELWGRMAEVASEHLHKGSQIHLAGKPVIEEWEKDGAKQRSFKLKVREMTFLGKRGDAPAAGAGAGSGGRNGGGKGPDSGIEEDIPF